MKTVNIQEAKTQLSKLLVQVAAGETIIINKAGAPQAVLSKWQPVHATRKGGGWSGKAWITKDFDAPDPEVEALFTGTSVYQPTLRVAEDSPLQNR